MLIDDVATGDDAFEDNLSPAPNYFGADEAVHITFYFKLIQPIAIEQQWWSTQWCIELDLRESQPEECECFLSFRLVVWQETATIIHAPNGRLIIPDNLLANVAGGPIECILIAKAVRFKMEELQTWGLFHLAGFATGIGHAFCCYQKLS